MTTVTAKRFSIAEYHRLGELGFFAPDDRVELIRGELIIKAAKGRFHSVCKYCASDLSRQTDWQVYG